MNNKSALEAFKEMTNDPNIEFIGIDDTFDFECQQCGSCCIHRGDIIINPFDVFRAAKHLGISCTEFLKKYAVPSYGGDSRIPLVLLSSDEKTGFCPMLKLDVKNGCKFKCIVHDAKPVVCWNHPIGTVLATPTDDLSLDGDLATEEYEYIKVTQCENSKGHNHLHTVRDWIKPSIEHAEELRYAHMLQARIVQHFSPKLFDFVMDMLIECPIDDLPEGASEAKKHFFDLKNLIFTSYIGIAYANYDTSVPFVEQAKENIGVLDNLLKDTAKYLKTVCMTMPEDVKQGIMETLNDKHCFDWMERTIGGDKDD